MRVDRRPSYLTVGIQFFREGKATQDIAETYKIDRLLVENLIRKYIHKQNRKYKARLK